MEKDIVFETRCLSSLSKVFADEALGHEPFCAASALRNEIYSFQVAYRSARMIKPIRVRVESEDLGRRIEVREVGLVPSELPCFDDYDGNVLRTAPGLYPDPLYPIEAAGVVGMPGQWRSVWVTVRLDGQARTGIHDIHVYFEKESGETLGKETFRLDVIPAELPKQRLIHTEWFHTDCLSTHYGLEVFGEEHWHRIGQFVETAAAHGINMILTPLFTPPLDTAVGGERPTVQLVGVAKEGERYRFDFSRLARWVEMCSEKGIEYFEFSHLFTQWGAKHAPKIMAMEDGELRRIFGWETDAAGEAYETFLSQFLPELVKFIKRNGLEKRSYFHVSDEPGIEHLEHYKAAAGLLETYLREFPIIDALSDYSFYAKGLVRHPIATNDHIEPFLANGVEPLWTYYCVSQRQKVSNRFFHMPSARNRVIGMQLYKFAISGFLHWGYNFWYAQYSKKPVNPFIVTDADRYFPSGDAFVVYPGAEGPIESLRLEVFYEALQDLRALELLESITDKQYVLRLLEEGIDKPLTFAEYPRDQAWLLGIREKVNRTIAERVNAAAQHP